MDKVEIKLHVSSIAIYLSIILVLFILCLFSPFPIIVFFFFLAHFRSLELSLFGYNLLIYMVDFQEQVNQKLVNSIYVTKRNIVDLFFVEVK